MNRSSTALFDPREEEQPLSSSRLLGSSIGSLTSPRKARSEISKVYKQASDLFLTRRLLEALSTIAPLIAIPKPSEQDSGDDDRVKSAPIAGATRSWRIKVWSFYLTLLNAIAELGPEDGKAIFGSKEWKKLVAKAQEGTIWQEVVDIGYGGIEGNVDADVVINLATLLLAQSSNQTSNQQYLETYLSASSNPSLDLTDHFNAADSLHGQTNGRISHNGTDTPRDVNARTKIIELYSLHVLPQNGDWEFARNFINMNEVLDEDVKETFLQALRELEDDEHKSQEHFEDALPQQDGLLEQEPLPADDVKTESAETVKQQPSIYHRRPDSERDYGIDNAPPPSASPESKSPVPKPTVKPARTLQPKSSRSSPTKAPRKTAESSIYERSLALLSALQHFISNMSNQMSKNPMVLLRFVLFLMGLVVAFSRRDVKDRLGRLTGAGWDKVKRTVGMGVKVSYI
ncbi:hypothetical protein MMC28_001507 [Mycoblastus sanguinarius]|nr:hypothetical protein [Mycoblastus sanguinarius]